MLKLTQPNTSNNFVLKVTGELKTECKIEIYMSNKSYVSSHSVLSIIFISNLNVGSMSLDILISFAKGKECIFYLSISLQIYIYIYIYICSIYIYINVLYINVLNIYIYYIYI